MVALMKALWKDDSGQALVEYALVVGVAAVAVVGLVITFRGQLLALWQGMTASMSEAVAAGGGTATP